MGFENQLNIPQSNQNSLEKSEPEKEAIQSRFSPDRVIQSIRETLVGEMDPEEKKIWARVKRYYIGISAGFALLSGNMSGHVAEREWEDSVTPEQIVTEGIREGDQFKLAQAFREKFSGIDIEEPSSSNEDLSMEEYQDYFSQFGPHAQVRLLEDVKHIEVRPRPHSTRSSPKVLMTLKIIKKER